jgi:hypothetical protein
VVARLLATPWLEDNADYLAEVGRHTARSDLGAQLGLLSAVLFIPVALSVAGLVREHHPRLSVIGGALAVTGAVGLACVYLASMVAGQMALLDDRDAMIELADRLGSAPPLQLITLLLAAGAVGWVTLAAGLYRSQAVPGACAVLVGVGGAAIMLTAAGPVRAAVAGSAVVAVVGFGWVATASRRGAIPQVQTSGPRLSVGSA